MGCLDVFGENIRQIAGIESLSLDVSGQRGCASKQLWTRSDVDIPELKIPLLKIT